MQLIRCIVFSGIILLSGLIFTEAQETKSVSGIITAFTNIPLNNVSVLSQKAGDKAQTNSQGQFTVKCLDKDVLIVTASGFKTKKVKIRNEQHFKIDLSYEDNTVNFNDAVSNGHVSGSVLKESVLAAEKASRKDYSKYKSIFDLVASEIYNVKVEGTTIINPQRRSLESVQRVLLVVDGKIVTDISFVAPMDVKSIEFIDDVGASFYGQQGANGVLKITLK